MWNPFFSLFRDSRLGEFLLIKFIYSDHYCHHCRLLSSMHRHGNLVAWDITTTCHFPKPVAVWRRSQNVLKWGLMMQHRAKCRVLVQLPVGLFPPELDRNFQLGLVRMKVAGTNYFTTGCTYKTKPIYRFFFFSGCREFHCQTGQKNKTKKKPFIRLVQIYIRIKHCCPVWCHTSLLHKTAVLNRNNPSQIELTRFRFHIAILLRLIPWWTKTQLML